MLTKMAVSLEVPILDIVAVVLACISIVVTITFMARTPTHVQVQRMHNETNARLDAVLRR